MMAEDHNSARQAYVSLLGEENNFVVTGHAENGFELLKLMERNVPDIVITDLDMPVMGGQKLVEVLRLKFPRIRVIVLSIHEEEMYVSQLIVNGACAYLSKRCDFAELVFTVNKVFTDGYYFNTMISKIIIASAGSVPAMTDELSLSPREIEVLQLICNEKSSQQIALLLDISIATVAFHRKNISRKTKRDSVLGLYKYALKNGIAIVE